MAIMLVRRQFAMPVGGTLGRLPAQVVKHPHQRIPARPPTAKMPGADLSQWVQPASVASLIAWLAGDAGKDVTGAAIPVYGGGL